MKRNDLLILLIILVVNVLFKLYNITYSSFDLDEAVHVWFAQLPLDEVIAQAANDPNPPLFNVLISGWIKTLGISELAIRWFSLLFSALAAGALFVFLRRNVNMRVAVIAAVLFTVSAVQVRFAHNARPYTMLVFLVICSYGMLLEVLRRPSPLKFVGYFFATALMLYAHPTSVFNLPAQALFVLPRLRSDWRTVLLIGGCQVLAIGTYMLWYVSIPYFRSDPGTWLQPPTWAEALVHIRYLNGSADNDAMLIVQLAMAVLGAIFLVFIQKDNKSVSLFMLALLWTAVPFLGNFAFSHMAEPIFQGKYVLSAQLGMVVLMAVSIDALKWQWLRWPVFAAVAVLLVFHIDFKSTSGEDWRAAAAHVKADEGPRTATFISPWFEFRSFAYYFDREAYTDPHITQKVLVAKNVFTAWHDVVAVGASQSRFKRLHLIWSQPSVENMQPRIDSLLQRGKLVAETKLEGITIYTFDLPSPPPVMHLDFESAPSAEAYAGRGAEQLGTDREFSANILFPLDDAFIADTDVEVSAAVRSPKGLEQVFLVVSIIRNGEYLVNIQQPVASNDVSSTSWTTLQASFRYELAKHAGADIKVFVWNPDRKPVWVDDLRVVKP
jgi:hypothetical protein